jgi:hypothetical protein
VLCVDRFCLFVICGCQLAKPLLADVKRAVSQITGLPPSTPGPSSLPPIIGAGAGRLPPIGKRWMKAAEFAAFAHSMVTERFLANTQAEEAATSAASGADSATSRTSLA